MISKGNHVKFARFVAFRQWKSTKCIIKQLLDSVFVISRIIKVEVGFISRSRRLRLITLTETLIILDTTKTSPNNCLKLLDQVMQLLGKCSNLHFSINGLLESVRAYLNESFKSCIKKRQVTWLSLKLFALFHLDIFRVTLRRYKPLFSVQYIFFYYIQMYYFVIRLWKNALLFIYST